jgi:hypothetical protein
MTVFTLYNKNKTLGVFCLSGIMSNVRVGTHDVVNPAIRNFFVFFRMRLFSVIFH